MSEIKDIENDPTKRNFSDGPLVFPNKTNKVTTGILFFGLLIVIATTCWILLRKAAGYTY